MPDSEPQSLPPALVDDRRSPWLRLPGALAGASDARLLALAVVGVVLTRWGGLISSAMFSDDPGRLDLDRTVIAGLVDRQDWGLWLGSSASIAADPWFVFIRPIRNLLELGRGNGFFARSLFDAAWVVVVWGLIGGTIARMAAVKATGTIEEVGLGAALRFVGRRRVALVSAPLGPMIVLGGLAVPGAVIGLMSRSESELFEGISSTLAIVPVLLAVPSALLLVGVVACWPLMVLTVAVEGEDGFEALSRAFSYLRRRAGHYALAVLGSWVLGTIGVVLAGLLAGLVIHLASWAVALGGVDHRIDDRFQSRAPGVAAPSVEAAPDRLPEDVPAFSTRVDAVSTTFEGLPPRASDAILAVWLRCVGLVSYAWAFSFFWSAFARIYLLLRLEVDGTPWQDLDHPDEDAEPFAPDPPSDEQESA